MTLAWRAVPRSLLYSPSGGLEKFGLVRYLRFHLIADGQGLLLISFLVVTFLVAKDDPDRSERLAAFVLQGALYFEMIAGLIHFKIALAGVDHAHVILVRLFAVAAYVGGDDLIVLLVGRRDVHGHNDHVLMFGQRFIEQFLRKDLRRVSRSYALCLLRDRGTACEQRYQERE